MFQTHGLLRHWCLLPDWESQAPSSWLYRTHASPTVCGVTAIKLQLWSLKAAIESVGGGDHGGNPLRSSTAHPSAHFCRQSVSFSASSPGSRQRGIRYVSGSSATWPVVGNAVPPYGCDTGPWYLSCMHTASTVPSPSSSKVRIGSRSPHAPALRPPCKDPPTHPHIHPSTTSQIHSC